MEYLSYIYNPASLKYNEYTTWHHGNWIFFCTESIFIPLCFHWPAPHNHKHTSGCSITPGMPMVNSLPQKCRSALRTCVNWNSWHLMLTMADEIKSPGKTYNRSKKSFKYLGFLVIETFSGTLSACVNYLSIRTVATLSLTRYL